MQLPPNVTPEAMAVIEEKARERVAANPPDPKRYVFGLVVGMTFDEPDPGWCAGKCDHCHEAIVIGPASQQVMSLNALLRAVCLPCMFALIMLGYNPGEAVDPRDIPLPEG